MTKLAQNFYLICSRIGKNDQEKKTNKKKLKKSLKKKQKGIVQEQLAEATKVI